MLKKNTKLTTKKPLTKTISNNSSLTQKALKEAYQLVQTDLLNIFQKMKTGQSIRLNGIGTFEKQKRKTTSYLKKTKGNIYTYYQIKFRMSQTLKQALD